MSRALKYARWINPAKIFTENLAGKPKGLTMNTSSFQS